MYTTSLLVIHDLLITHSRNMFTRTQLLKKTTEEYGRGDETIQYWQNIAIASIALEIHLFIVL